NASVAMDNKRAASSLHYVDNQQSDVQSIRVIKGTLQTDLNTLTKECSLEDLSQQLIDSDPEIDIELFGKRVHDTSRIYLNSHNEPASAVTAKEFFYEANGELKEERDLQVTEANINTETPLSWSGKLMPKMECYKKFVF